MDRRIPFNRTAATARAAFLVAVMMFVTAIGLFDWFRLAGFEESSSTSYAVLAFRALCVLSGVFWLLAIPRTFALVRRGSIADLENGQMVASGHRVFAYSVAGRRYERATSTHPSWLFGKPLGLVVYDPAHPEKGILLYEWMLGWTGEKG